MGNWASLGDCGWTVGADKVLHNIAIMPAVDRPPPPHPDFDSLRQRDGNAAAGRTNWACQVATLDIEARDFWGRVRPWQYGWKLAVGEASWRFADGLSPP
jgi:hypothetical protein